MPVWVTFETNCPSNWYQSILSSAGNSRSDTNLNIEIKILTMCSLGRYKRQKENKNTPSDVSTETQNPPVESMLFISWIRVSKMKHLISDQNMILPVNISFPNSFPAF